MRTLAIFAAAMVAAAVLAGAASFAADLTAADIVAKSDDLMRGETSYSVLSMHIQTPYYQRDLKMKVWTKGRDLAFIRILEPAKDAGVAFLKDGRQMYNYLPNVEQTIKIPPSMMSQSWMGSDFTNNDLSRADTMIVDYTHKILEEVDFQGARCWKIELTAKPDAPVVWQKILVWIDQQNYIMRQAEYLDEDGQVARVMTVDDIGKVGDRWVGKHWRMVNRKEEGHITEMTFNEIEFDLALPPETFTKRNLTMGNR